MELATRRKMLYHTERKWSFTNTIISKQNFHVNRNPREKRKDGNKRLRHRAAQIVKVADAIAAADIEGAEDIGG